MSMMIETKICTKCKIDKPLSEYHKRGERDAPRSWCIECLKVQGRMRVNRYRKQNLLQERSNEETLVKCTKCKRQKLHNEFYRNVSSKCGISSLCKDCKKEGDFTWRRSVPGRYRIYVKTARRKGLTFLLTFENFESIITKECSYCGQEPALGVDRKDNAIGYEEGNCVPCCKLCNQFKWDNEIEFFIEHVHKISKYLKRRKK